jgi:hypothetical protein
LARDPSGRSASSPTARGHALHRGPFPRSPRVLTRSVGHWPQSAGLGAVAAPLRHTKVSAVHFEISRDPTTPSSSATSSTFLTRRDRRSSARDAPPHCSGWTDCAQRAPEILGALEDPYPYLAAAWLFNVSRRGRIYTSEEHARMRVDAGFAPPRRLEEADWLHALRWVRGAPNAPLDRPDLSATGPESAPPSSAPSTDSIPVAPPRDGRTLRWSPGAAAGIEAVFVSTQTS